MARTWLVQVDQVRHRKAQRFNGEKTFEHRVIVERLLGRKLSRTVEIHHLNGNALDNRHENLVVCPDHSYHMLLHARQKALDACGNASYRCCIVCKLWDSPDNMRVSEYFNTHTGYAYTQCIHKSCNRERTRAWRKKPESLVC
jgi:hypothetical protein